MKWYPRACPICGGDMHDDLDDRGWLTCFMCARSLRKEELREPLPLVGAAARLSREPEREEPEAA